MAEGGERIFKRFFMMNKNARFVKIVTLLVILMTAGVSRISYADPAMESADQGIDLGTDARLFTWGRSKRGTWRN